MKTIHGDLENTSSQAYAISKAITMLQNSKEGLLFVESEPGQGKTTTAMFLVENIGRDTDFLDLFIKLQKKIYYFDASTESLHLDKLLSDKALAAKALIIIDNLHKLSTERLDIILDKLNMIFEHNRSIHKTGLIILLCQNTSNTNATKQQIKEYLTVNNPEIINVNYSCKNNVKTSNIIDEKGTILHRISRIEDSLLQPHLLRMYNHSSNRFFLEEFSKTITGNHGSINPNFLTHTYFIAIIVLLSAYLGFVSKDSVLKLWKLCPPNNTKMRSGKKLFKFFLRQHFLIPFPLLDKAFLFNEKLAREIRKKLFSFSPFQEYYFKCAKYIFDGNFINSNDFRWLFLSTCSMSDLKTVTCEKRERSFYSCIETLNKNYILEALEDEIIISPEKRNIFRIELCTLYIQTGRWTEARNILKPYITKSVNGDEIWNLQLQIIEADHGVDDIENINMLSCISKNSDDEYIRFQACYWMAHINMELGDFSLEPWDELKKHISINHEWNRKKNYAHIIHRVTADTLRTYFLKGIQDYNYFNDTINFFTRFRKMPLRQEDCALEELELAHYLHYDIVYQLGIWKHFRFPHDPIKTLEGSLTIYQITDDALRLYSKSISVFKNSGNKTWRTAQARRDELSLVSPNPNFVEILSRLDEFISHAQENEIHVHEAYAKCLYGKACAVFSFCKSIGDDDSHYEHQLSLAINKLSDSIKIYEGYGNCYGAFRSEILFALVEAVLQSGILENVESIPYKLNEKLTELTSRYDKQKKFSREQQIIEYILSLEKLKIRTIIDVIKHYPIVLQ